MCFKSYCLRLVFVLGFACLFQSEADAQQISLLCVTKYSDYARDIRDVVVDSVIVKASSKTVSVLNVPEFNSSTLVSYETTVFTDDSIKFKTKAKPSYFGVINRYSGKLSISELSEDGKRLIRLLEGNCDLANKRF